MSINNKSKNKQIFAWFSGVVVLLFAFSLVASAQTALPNVTANIQTKKKLTSSALVSKVLGQTQSTNTSATAKASPSVSLSLSANEVVVGSYVYATPHLTGETNNVAGTLTYLVFNNSTCTGSTLHTDQKTVLNGNGANSEAWQLPLGKYHWQVVYSGNGNNQAAISSCADAGAVLGVYPAAHFITPDPTASSTISGTVYHDQNGDDEQDSNEPALAGFKVWLHLKSATSSGSNGYNWPIIATDTTDANGHYSFSNLALGTYFVEQEEPSGWDQRVDDQKVRLTDSDESVTDVDFPNVKVTDTNNDQDDEDDDNDNGGQHEDKDKKDKKEKNENRGRGAKKNGWPGSSYSALHKLMDGWKNGKNK